MRKPLSLFLLRAWLPVLLLLVWWFASRNSESLYFPPLTDILQTLRSDWLGAHFMKDLVPTLLKLIVGFLVSVLLGVLIGLLLGLSRPLRALTDYVILFFRSLPPPVLVPIGIIILGIGATMNVFILVLGAVWPTIMGTIDGVRSLDLGRRDMARSYRLSLWERMIFIVLPNASPQILAGMRTTLQLSIILVIVAEMLASATGVGHYVLASQQTFEVTATWAGTLLLGIIGYVSAILFMMFERRVLRWQEVNE